MNIDVNKPLQLLFVLSILGSGIYISVDDLGSSSNTEAVEIPGSDDRTNESQSSLSGKSSNLTSNETDERKTRTEIIEQKESKYRKARPLVEPDGYINTENVSIQQNIGQKVILLDMWTYSCINCQRTLPYLNEWHRKYSDDGLLIIGNHAPEFEFEKERSNVEEAVERYNISYPVVLDNDKQTWDAYNNRYWPQKYLIGVDGFIRYEHIGEGSYNETEEKIVELLEERNERLGIEDPIDSDGFDEDNPDVNFSKIKTPEIYFGAFRNENLENGASGRTGTQSLEVPSDIKDDRLYLEGVWNIESEYAKGDSGDSIVISYRAESVNMVLDGNQTRLKIYQDGELIQESSGSSVQNSEIEVDSEKLYNIVQNQDYSRHRLKIKVVEGELDAYTFTFG